MTTEFDRQIHQKIYRIEISNYQLVELIEFKNGEFLGSLNHKVYELSRKEVIKDSLFHKITIPNEMAMSITAALHEGGIENLTDCEAIPNCISGLDGTTISFEAIKSRFHNKASYWELTSDYYYNQNNIELPKELMRARNLLRVLGEHFDLNKQFQNYLNRLPNGQYLYGMIIMKKKRR